ncbi:MAG: LPS assembly lipoprotein LptE [Candidatus Krumholzibacteriota bacterium]
MYSASSGRVDENLKMVAVQYLENLTPEPNLGVDLSDDIIRALQVDNTLKVVDEADADSIISGRVARYTLREVATTQELTVNEYQVQIAVVLTFTVRATGEKIFDKRRFTGTGNYVLNDNDVNEDTARDEAVEEIVRDILAQVVEDW